MAGDSIAAARAATETATPRRVNRERSRPRASARRRRGWPRSIAARGRPVRASCLPGSRAPPAGGTVPAAAQLLVERPAPFVVRRGPSDGGDVVGKVARRVLSQVLPRTIATGGRPSRRHRCGRVRVRRRLARDAPRGAGTVAGTPPPAGRALLPGGPDARAGRPRAELERGDPAPSPGQRPRPAPLPIDPAWRRGLRRRPGGRDGVSGHGRGPARVAQCRGPRSSRSGWSCGLGRSGRTGREDHPEPARGSGSDRGERRDVAPRDRPPRRPPGPGGSGPGRRSDRVEDAGRVAASGRG